MSGNGPMVHKLDTATHAHSLAPATTEEFEDVVMGSLLREKPSFLELDGVCTILFRG
jgi:hypothetical protein